MKGFFSNIFSHIVSEKNPDFIIGTSVKDNIGILLSGPKCEAKTILILRPLFLEGMG